MRVGDLVVTADGQSKPIRWIGRRKILRQADKSWPGDVLPVKVSRSALGPDVPSADLYLSPGHALYIDGLLITAESLANGRTITRCDTADVTQLEYFQIELDDHNVILAEGAAVETFLPSLDHSWFDNGADYGAQVKPTGEVAPFSPEIDMAARRLQLQSRFRSALSPLVDRRTPFDKVRDNLEDWAERMASAG